MIELETKWEEIDRPGHTVVIISNSIDKRASGRDMQKVTYKHIGVHNKRAQRFPTITEEWRFLRRFRPFDR
jgi:hypothetical protein